MNDWSNFEESIDNVVKRSESKPPDIIIDDHESAEYYILSLRKYFGFELDFDHPWHLYPISGMRLRDHFSLKDSANYPDRNLKIDITFFADDNRPKLCFEMVQTKATITKALNRCIKLKDKDTKLFIVSKNLKDFTREFQSIACNSIRARTFFISYDNLAKL